MRDGGNGGTHLSLVLTGVVTVVLFGFLYVAPLNLRPMFVPDEMRYAEIAREMVADGDCGRMRQAGLPYYEKPPLGYWLTAASISVFGENAFAVRLPSALSALGSALAIFLFIRRRRGASQGLVAVWIYLSCAQVFGMGTFAVLDSMFSFFVCLTMLLLCEGAMRAGRKRVVFLAASGVCCGAAFLTKGFVAVVMPALTLAAWLAWERRWRDLLTVWILPLAAACVIVLPFAVVIGRANPGFWEYFFWVEHVQRFLEPLDGQHREPFWFFIPVLVIGAIPWSFFLPVIGSAAVRTAGRDAGARFCLCWFGMSFLFFSACGGKLPTYLLPCFPPLAIVAVDAVLEAGRERALRRCAFIAAATVAAAMVGFMLWLLLSDHRFLREDLLGDAKTLVLGASLVSMAGCLYVAGRWFAKPGWGIRAAALIAFSLCGVALASIVALPCAVEDRRSPSRLLAEAVGLTPPDAFLLADRVTLPAVCWHFRRDDVAFFGGMGEMALSLRLAEYPGVYRDSPEDAAGLLTERLAAGRPVAVILTGAKYRELAEEMPALAPTAERRLLRFVWALFEPAGEDASGPVAALGRQD